MPDVNIKVKNKIAVGDGTVIICGNTDYTAVFDFDAEWDEYETKTARFISNGEYTDIVFTGNKCAIPAHQNTHGVQVGVFAGDLHTTTPAYFDCAKSILCDGGAPAAPAPDVYNQLMERLNDIETPDWHQNNSTSKSYIKNRICWGEDVQPLRLDGISIKYTDDGWYLGSEFAINRDTFFADYPISICKLKNARGEESWIYANTDKYKQAVLLDSNDNVIIRLGLWLNMNELAEQGKYWLQINTNSACLEEWLETLDYSLDDIRSIMLLGSTEYFERIKMNAIEYKEDDYQCTVATFENFIDAWDGTGFRRFPFVIEGLVNAEGKIEWDWIRTVAPYKRICVRDANDEVVFRIETSKLYTEREDGAYDYDVYGIGTKFEYYNYAGCYYAKELTFDPTAEFTIICESEPYIQRISPYYTGLIARTYHNDDVVFVEGNTRMIVDGELACMVKDFVEHKQGSINIQYITGDPSGNAPNLIRGWGYKELTPQSIIVRCGISNSSNSINWTNELMIFPNYEQAYNYWNR